MKALFFSYVSDKTDIVQALNAELNTPKGDFQRRVFASLIYTYGYFLMQKR
jgi:hypothetical protein